MPRYLWQASYTAEGTRALLKEGGTKRREVVMQMLEKGGGRLESFYFAFGEWDVVGIAEFPDEATAVAVSLTINASGVVRLRTTVLLTPEEMDRAAKTKVVYRPPGA